MARLECSSRKGTLESLASVTGQQVSALYADLAAYAPEAVLKKFGAGRPYEDALVKKLFGQWPETMSPPDEVVWFHGTRLPRVTTFDEGLLPFKVCLPSLTQTIEQLALEVGVPPAMLHKGETSGSHAIKLQLIDVS